MELNMLELQKTLQRYGVMINFSGRFTQAIIEQLGDAVKQYLETEATSLTDTYNVFSVFIEQTQNIRNYDVKKADSPFGDRIANSGIVAIGKTPTGYFVSSGNIVENSDISGLTTLLDEIVGLDKAGLKKRYKERLREAVPPRQQRRRSRLSGHGAPGQQPADVFLYRVGREFVIFYVEGFNLGGRLDARIIY